MLIELINSIQMTIKKVKRGTRFACPIGARIWSFWSLI